ncbi:MAG: efflux RND transporter permease subunit [Spirochaetota bacterium]|nr:efflux RND transporter permease subunit [Spirochaetota bacterium]
MKLPEFSVKYPVAILMLFIAVFLLGAIALSKLSIDMLPEIEPPNIMVITAWPGSSASDVESEVTELIEDQVSTVNNLKEVSSKSVDNLSVVGCEFEWGADLDIATNDIRDSLEVIKQRLPKDIERPMVLRIKSERMPILIMTVTAEQSWPSLRMILKKNVVDELKRVPGVGAFMVDGGLIRRINVYFDANKLEAYHLSILQINKILAAENLNIPAGSIETGEMEYYVRIPARFKTVEDIKNTVVGNFKGRIIYLRDVATVTDSFAPVEMNAWEDVGVKSMIMMVQKQSGKNAVEVIDGVKERLNQIKHRLPDDVKIQIAIDNSKQIRNAINNLRNTLFAGLFLVIVVTIIFLRRLRTAGIVSLVIPFSIIVAFIFMFIADFTINLISLMAIVITIGMVVDNGIVVLENIIRHVEHGGNRRTSAIYGASEMGMAITASTATTVIIFLPLIFVKGLAGVIFNQLAIVLGITLLASLFTSLSLTPMLASQWVEYNPVQTSSRGGRLERLYLLSEGWFNKVETVYERFLILALTNRWKTVVIALIIFFSSLLIIPFLSSTLMTDTDTGDLSVKFRLPEGTKLEETDRVVTNIFNDINSVVKKEEIDLKYAMDGTGEGGFAIAFGFDQGPNIGQVSFLLVEKNERERSVKRIADVVREKVRELPGISDIQVRAASMMSSMMLGGEKGVQVEIRGYDFGEMMKYAHRLSELMKKVPGLVNVSLSQRDPRPEVWIKIDRRKASALGLNVAMIASTLRNYYYGVESTELKDAGESFEIFTRLHDDLKDDIDRMMSMPLLTPDGRTIMLSSIAEIKRTEGPIQLLRKNRATIVKVGSDLQEEYHLGYAREKVNEIIASIGVPDGIFVGFGGLLKDQEETYGDLLLLLIVGILLVYMVMAALFENLRDPLIIMFSIPFAFTGVSIALFITGIPLSLMTIMSLIMLMGIVVNNAIVLVDYMHLLLKRGVPLYEAIVQTGKNRLRPVLMTTLTTLFGMLPMVLSRAESSEVWNAMGVTLIGGLTLSSLVTLILIPTIFYLFESRKTRQILQTV